MVEGADDLTFSSKAQEKMDTMSKYMMDASDESGPNSCGPGYIWNGTMCVPATGAMGLSGSAPADEGGVIKYASELLASDTDVRGRRTCVYEQRRSIR